MLTTFASGKNPLTKSTSLAISGYFFLFSNSFADHFLNGLFSSSGYSGGQVAFEFSYNKSALV